MKFIFVVTRTTGTSLFCTFPVLRVFLNFIFFRGHTEGGSSLHGSKGCTMQKRAGGS